MLDSEEGVKYCCNANHALTYFKFQSVEVFSPLCRFDFDHKAHKEGYADLSPNEKLSNRKTV